MSEQKIGEQDQKASILHRYLPLIGQMQGYNKEKAVGDFSAGLTTAVMLIPQAMAYSMLAGLDPVIGLYASIVPLFLYGLLGTSRQLAVGPVAMVSLLVASATAAIGGADASMTTLISLAVTLSLLIGIIQTAMGVFRLGFLVNFLSHPVVSGFTSAAALIIGLSQLKHLFGIKLQRSHHIHHILGQAWDLRSNIDLTTVIIGGIAIVILIVAKKLSPRFPRALLVVVVGTLAVLFGGFDVKIVGDIQAGLPGFVVPTFSNWEGLLPMAITISMVGFMESISVAKAFARKNRYTVDANQELIALGVANIGGAFTSASPVTGGFSRTAVNGQAGAKTNLASLLTAVIIAFTLLFLTPLFHDLPKAVLSAIIMTSVFGLIDFAEVKHLWHTSKSDLFFLALTFFATLSLGIEKGILIGMGASLFWVLYQTTKPRIVELSNVEGTHVYKDVEKSETLNMPEGVMALRLDARMYFGNVTHNKEVIVSKAKAKAGLKTLIIDFSSVNGMDSSAESALVGIMEELEIMNINVLFAGVKNQVKIFMEKTGLWNTLGEKRRFASVHCAVQSLNLNSPSTGGKTVLSEAA